MGNPYAPPGENPPPVQAPSGDAGPGPRPLHGGVPAGPPPGAPPGRPPRPGPTSEVARTTARRALHFFALLLAGVLTTSLPLPWQLGSLVFVLAAVVVGVRALVLGWRSGVRGGVLVALGTGIAMALVTGLLMATLLAVWPEQLARQECLARAVTISATQECEAQFQRSLDERVQRGTGTSTT